MSRVTEYIQEIEVLVERSSMSASEKRFIIEKLGYITTALRRKGHKPFSDVIIAEFARIYDSVDDHDGPDDRFLKAVRILTDDVEYICKTNDAGKVKSL